MSWSIFRPWKLHLINSSLNRHLLRELGNKNFIYLILHKSTYEIFLSDFKTKITKYDQFLFECGKAKEFCFHSK